METVVGRIAAQRWTGSMKCWAMGRESRPSFHGIVEEGVAPRWRKEALFVRECEIQGARLYQQNCMDKCRDRGTSIAEGRKSTDPEHKYDRVRAAKLAVWCSDAVVCAE